MEITLTIISYLILTLLQPGNLLTLVVSFAAQVVLAFIYHRHLALVVRENILTSLPSDKEKIGC